MGKNDEFKDGELDAKDSDIIHLELHSSFERMLRAPKNDRYRPTT